MRKPINKRALLVSFVNQSFSPSFKLALVIENKVGHINSTINKIGIGITGIIEAENQYVVGIQNQGLYVLDSNFQVRFKINSQFIKDPHSLLYQGGSLYCISTGTNEVVSFKYDSVNNSFKDEQVIWTYPNVSNNYDFVHLNSIIIVDNSIVVSGFGKRRKAQDWKEINEGFIWNIEANERIYAETNLIHPHSLTKAFGKNFILSSGTNELINLENDSKIKIPGYLRGMTEHNSILAFGLNLRRHVINHEIDEISSRIGKLEDSSVENCRIGFLDIESNKIIQFIDLSHFGDEIYDIRSIEISEETLSYVTFDYLEEKLISQREVMRKLIQHIPKSNLEVMTSLASTEFSLEKVNNELQKLNAYNHNFKTELRTITNLKRNIEINFDKIKTKNNTLNEMINDLKIEKEKEKASIIETYRNSLSWKIGYSLTRIPALIITILGRITSFNLPFTKLSKNLKSNIEIKPNNSNNDPIILSLNPDLENNFGHFLRYDEEIFKNLPHRHSFIALVNKKIQITPFFDFFPVFTQNSWNIGRLDQYSNHDTQIFKQELSDSIEKIKSKYSDSTVIIYMYCGSLNHSIIIDEVIREYQGIKAHVNLFWENFNTKEIATNVSETNSKFNLLSAKTKVYYDSEELKNTLRSLGLISFETWPFFSLLNKEILAETDQPLSENKVVYFPSNMRLNKGYKFIVEFINQLTEERDDIEFRLRKIVNKTTSKKELDIAKTISNKAKIIYGELSDEDFIMNIQSAHIIVIPYSSSEFSTRTSGLYADATLLGKPIIATEKTWMAKRIDEYKNGLTYKEGSIESLRIAIDRIFDHYDHFSNQAIRASVNWKKNNNIRNFYDLIGSKYKGIIVSFFPKFKNITEFQNQFFRISWYLIPEIESVAKIQVALEDRVHLDDLKKNIPSFFDPKIQEYLEIIWSKIVFQADLSTEEYLSSHSILHHNLERTNINDERKLNVIRKNSQIKLWRVDTNNERNEASFYNRLSRYINPDIEYEVLKGREKLLQLTRKHIGKKCFVFGTGPNLEQVMSMDEEIFAKSITIACNSMVKNEALLKKLCPDIIVAADPIFHAGVSSYAAKFRFHLQECLEKYNSLFVVPLRDYKLYKAHLDSKYAERIIGIPLEKMPIPNINLMSKFTVKSYPNVLTLFLLPLAATFSRDIYIGGCDGREIRNDGSYYWKHHKSSQLNNEMEPIQKTHPAFFQIDYNDYYEEHISELTSLIESIELRGHRVFNVTKSYIPCLSQRTDNNQLILATINKSNNSIDESNLAYNYLNRTAVSKNIINVGAHHGSSIAKFVRNNYNVVAFEPDAKNREYLTNRFVKSENLRIDHRAVSDKPSENLPFYSSSTSTGISSLLNFHDSHEQTQTVDVTTLHEYCKEEQIKDIDLLLIDTEGYDFFVLKGNNWNKLKPKIVIAEFENRKTKALNYSLRDMIHLLKQHNYEIFISHWKPIVEYGETHQWDRLIPVNNFKQEDFVESWGNLIAFHDSYDVDHLQNSIDLEVVHTIEPISKDNIPNGNTLNFDGTNSLKSSVQSEILSHLRISLFLKTSSNEQVSFNRELPQMPFLIGDVKLYQLNLNLYRLGVGSLEFDLRVAEEGLFLIELFSLENCLILRVNDTLIYEDHSWKKKLKINQYTLGQGFFERFWNGKIYEVQINHKNIWLGTSEHDTSTK